MRRVVFFALVVIKHICLGGMYIDFALVTGGVARADQKGRVEGTILLLGLFCKQ